MAAPWFQFAVLFVTCLGMAGLGGLLYIVWPFRHERGGTALVTLIFGFAATFAWLLALDTLSMLYGLGVLPAQPVRVLVSRALVTAAAWATLIVMRWGGRP